MLMGIVDEAVQWVIPDRYWGLEDIYLDASAALLTIAAVALGVRPSDIDRRPGWCGVQIASRWAMVTLLAILLTVLNTPDRIDWYAARIPALQFVITNNSVMWEYGYFYRDAEIGIFRSRLDAQPLRETDRRRAQTAASILNQYPERRDYRIFLKSYTPVNDAFLHELRVHLFRRDVYFGRWKNDEYDATEWQRFAHIAYYENKIVEKYFQHTLQQSVFKWPAEHSQQLADKVERDARYESPVSQRLFTAWRESDVLTALGVLFALFIAANSFATLQLHRESATQRKG